MNQAIVLLCFSQSGKHILPIDLEDLYLSRDMHGETCLEHKQRSDGNEY